MNTKSTVLITGASSGIGYELAKIFAKNGYNLVLVARNKERLEEIKVELYSYTALPEKQNIEISVISKDLSKQESAQGLFDELEKQNILVDILVNNAGFGDRGVFYKTDIQKQMQMVNLNIFTLTMLTRLLLPKMVERKTGRVVNIASVASFLPGPFMPVYYASKAYVLSFSEAIAEELRGSGVTVTCICPGPTETDFANKADMKDSPLFKLPVAMTSEKVAEISYKGLMKGRRVVITGISNKLQVYSLRLIPRWLAAKVVGSLQKGE